MPAGFLRDRLKKEIRLPGINNDIAEAIAGALSGKPVEAVFQVNGRTVRIKEINITEGLLSVRLVPLG